MRSGTKEGLKPIWINFVTARVGHCRSKEADQSRNVAMTAFGPFFLSGSWCIRILSMRYISKWCVPVPGWLPNWERSICGPMSARIQSRRNPSYSLLNSLVPVIFRRSLTVCGEFILGTGVTSSCFHSVGYVPLSALALGI